MLQTIVCISPRLFHAKLPLQLTLVTFACALFLAAAPEAPAQPTLTKAPALTRFVEATYPPEAFATGKEAEVVLDIDIDVAGSVTAATVVKSAGPEFDHAALEAVSQFAFSPAEFDGVPTPVRLTYRYLFDIQEERVAIAPAGGTITLQGQLLERGTRRPIAGATVAIEGGPVQESDAEGRFAFRALPPSQYQLRVASADHQKLETQEEVLPGEATAVTYFLRRRSYSPYEAVVRGDRERKEVARKTLAMEEIKKIPGTSGDAVAVVNNLPGASRIPFGLGLLVVRGTRPEDTRNHLDGIWIPLIFHFGGFPVSVVNADALAGIDFYTGNFSGRFGRALGGAIEVRTRRPNRDGYHGFVDASALDVKTLVEGPTTERGSFIATARRSHIDSVLRAADVKVISPKYFDYYLRHDWDLERGAHVALYAYGASDELKLNIPNGFSANPEEVEGTTTSLAFHRLQGSYERPIGERLSNRTVASVGVDLRKLKFGSTVDGDGKIYLGQVRSDLIYTASEHLELTLGIDAGVGRFDYAITSPSFSNITQIPDPVVSRQLQRDVAAGNFATPGVYLFATWQPTSALRIVPSLRADYEYYLNDGRVDPRLASFYEFAPWLTVKAAAGFYSATPDFNQGQTLKKLGNPNLKLQASRQYMAGVSGRLGERTSYDVQIYYKQLYNVAVRSEELVVRDGKIQRQNWANAGDGFGRGIEVLLRQEMGAGFFGWIAYTLSEAKWRLFEKGPLVNFPLDQRHNLVGVVSYALPKDFTVGTSARYTTGNWQTPIPRAFFDADCDCYLPLIGKIASVRTPDFFQVDVRVDKLFVFNRWRLNTYLDVRNVLNRANVEASNYNYDFSEKVPLNGIPIFPNLGLRGEF